MFFPVCQKPSSEEGAFRSILGVKLSNKKVAWEFGAESTMFNVVFFCTKIHSAFAVEQVSLLVAAAVAVRGFLAFIVWA